MFVDRAEPFAKLFKRFDGCKARDTCMSARPCWTRLGEVESRFENALWRDGFGLGKGVRCGGDILFGTLIDSGRIGGWFERRRMRYLMCASGRVGGRN